MTAVHSRTYTVKVGDFEGPLELLLDLIERRKFSINQISLAKVADDYIAHVQTLSEYPVAMTAHFILVASTLLLIKSKSLLPALSLTEDEQGSIADLERRLKIYKKIKECAAMLRPLFCATPLFEPCERPAIPVFSAHASITLQALLSSVQHAIQSVPRKELLPKTVVEKVISLEEMIESLTARVQTALKTTFREFASGHSKRVDVIVSFLAMLELVKQGVINVSQEEHFDDIIIETSSLSVPRYA